jgi:hypothetical protein
MRALKRFFARIRNFATGRHGDERLREEIEQHIAMQAEENTRAGLSPEEARRQARLQFGAVDTIREQYRAEESLQIIEAFLRDMRISVRTLLRSPGFSITAVLVMALCIGAATSLFTVVRSVMLRPLPFSDPDRLVMVYEHFRDPSMNAQGFNYNGVAPGDYYDWRTQTHGFEDMAAWRYWQFNLTGERGELPEMISAGGGSWNLFSLFGVHAVFGRTFVESEDRPDGNAVMLTWNLFERRSPGIHQLSADRFISTESHTRWWGCFRSRSPIPMQRCKCGSHSHRGCRPTSSNTMTITSRAWWPA